MFIKKVDFKKTQCKGLSLKEMRGMILTCGQMFVKHTWELNIH